MVVDNPASLPYHEPDIITILVQVSFLLLLNVVNAALDRIVFCGLLGQVLVGVAWGTPGAQWLSTHVQEVVVQLGYLGLILLVYEGGLSTSFKSLKANLSLSSAVALTGIVVPIGLSFSLQGLLGATPIQAFAAGAALCSTSLGTTFTVLASSGLSTSRLGVVLTSAAMMDDVVGLVMVEVISNLGGGSIDAVTVVRPILVSLAFAFVAPLGCRFIVKPVTLSLNRYRETHTTTKLASILNLPQTAFAIHTLLLIALVAGATYAGTSNLFAAYIAGSTISWWDSELPHPTQTIARAHPEKTSMTEVEPATHKGPTDQPTDSGTGGKEKVEKNAVNKNVPSAPDSPTAGAAIYQRYYAQAVTRILQPFFFASIGFSIPITRMFGGQIIWRGIIYAILMTLGKLVCGLWLVRLSFSPAKGGLRGKLSKVKLPSVPHLWGRERKSGPGASANQARAESVSTQTQPSSKPFSLHPPLILALAMTARGEIGFLISAVAESKGVFASSSSGNGNGESDIFLVVTWAIVLCTIIGPLGVGLCVRRVKTLEARKNREYEGAGRDVLGVWGVG